MEEIRRILQSSATVGSPARTFLGMSPPARCSDGIVHDAAWHRRNCRAPQNLYAQVRTRQSRPGFGFGFADGPCFVDIVPTDGLTFATYSCAPRQIGTHQSDSS